MKAAGFGYAESADAEYWHSAPGARTHQEASVVALNDEHLAPYDVIYTRAMRQVDVEGDLCRVVDNHCDLIIDDWMEQLCERYPWEWEAIKHRHMFDAAMHRVAHEWIKEYNPLTILEAHGTPIEWRRA